MTTKEAADYRRKMTRAFVILTAVFVLVVVGLTITYNDTRNLATENQTRITEVIALAVKVSILQERTDKQFREADARQVATIRKLLCFQAKQVLTSKQRTDEEKAGAIAFYNANLAIIHAKPCNDPRLAPK